MAGGGAGRAMAGGGTGRAIAGGGAAGLTTAAGGPGLFTCWADESTLAATTETPRRRNAVKRRPSANMIVATWQLSIVARPVSMRAQSQRASAAIDLRQSLRLCDAG
jgi:hypothetical protein